MDMYSNMSKIKWNYYVRNSLFCTYQVIRVNPKCIKFLYLAYH